MFSTPVSGLKRFEGWEKSVTPAQVQAVFKKWMQMKNPLFFMSSTVDRPGVEAEIVKAWEESAKIAVKPPEAKSALTFAYTDFGTPGKVASDTRMADIDTRMIVFENNVRLNLKRTTFSKNAVQVSVRVGNGDLDLPETPYGFSSIASALSGGGLEKHSADDLRTILAGKQVQTRFATVRNVVRRNLRHHARRPLLQLQVSAAFLTHPGYRPEAERRWRQSVELAWPRLDANAGTVWSAKGMRMLASGDTRFGSDKDDGETKRTFAELKPILAPRLASGAIEIAIVGDMDEQAAIDAVAKTFGALPKRESIQTKFKAPNPPKFRADKIADRAHPCRRAEPGARFRLLAREHRSRRRSAGRPRHRRDGHGDAPQGDRGNPRGAGRNLFALRQLIVVELLLRLRLCERGRRGEAGGRRQGHQGAGKDRRADAGRGHLDDEFSRAITPQLEVLPQNATSNGYWVSDPRPGAVTARLYRAQQAACDRGRGRKMTKADIIAAANNGC